MQAASMCEGRGVGIPNWLKIVESSGSHDRPVILDIVREYLFTFLSGISKK